MIQLIRMKKHVRTKGKESETETERKREREREGERILDLRFKFLSAHIAN